MNGTVYTHDEKGHRTDVHRPGMINPGDYEYVGVDYKRKHPVTGGPAGTCHHCGKAIVWEVKWLHKPSNNVVTFGETCTEILGMSNDRIAHEMVLLKRQAENERRQEKAKLEREDREIQFRAEQPEVVKFLDMLEDDESFEFLRDMKQSFAHWGSLTDRQVESVKKCMAGRERFLARKMQEAIEEEQIPAFVEGRYEMVGTVLSHDWYDNHFTGGRDHKMLVKLDNGNRVFGSVPRDISNYLYHNDENESRELKGMRVKFTATAEQKKGEDHFGYFKRPSKASVVA